MLKKTERLTTRQFAEFFKMGKRHQFSHCTIIYTPYQTLHASVVVSKKVAKQAVKRNTLRRRVYAQLYQHLKRAEKTGVYIVILKPTFSTLTRASAAEQITTSIATVLKNT